MRRVLVTGGSRGVGWAVCRRLVGDGWQVMACARRSTREVTELARSHPDQFQFDAVDLGDPVARKRWVKAAGMGEGIDALVVNAAVGLEGLLSLTSEQALRECVELNLVVAMLLAREAVKGMLARGRGGSLVFVSSVAARTGLRGLSVYTATKGGLVAFSRSLARELGARGIRSNCVLPGFLETEMSASLGEAQRAQVLRRTALGRLGQGEDVAGAVSYLLSDDARQVTGTELVVDGGMTC